VTSKPLTIVEASQNMKAFIISVNNPSVRMLIGKVRKIITGRMIALITPNTAEVMSADQKLEKLIPGTMYATIIKTEVFSSQ